ncbi:MAG: heme transporter HemC [Candidatus Pelagibacter sp. TMED128]|nr:MAG: heme transporter HemC [Candidatus Pelagibacter sp. TMED128]|tara:strand:+ start:226 stop:933 length:708 start_codon:yes stop_codon:yes gene_type:complete
MFDLINPSKIFYLIEKIINFINSIFFIILIIALTFALILSPPDYLQGDSVRIMYVHVPSAWIGLASFTSIALLSILNFIFKIKNLHLISKSIAPLGLMFTCLAIITGSLWGQPTWGTWWAWDARITSMVVLAIFYILFILANKLIEQKDKANKISNIIAIVGLANIPIIKFSVDWWNTLHQPSSIKLDGTSSIHSSMLLPLMLMFLVLLLYCALILLMKYKTEIIRIKKKNIKRI